MSRRARVLAGLARVAMAVPERAARAVLPRLAVNARGERIEPDVDRLRRLETVLGTSDDVAASRLGMRMGCAIVGGRRREVSTSELTVAGRPARRYRPPDPRGTLVYLHGGGWCVGDLDTHDPLCRRLAVEAGWEVVALDYPLAPEHPFPAALDHVVAAYRELGGPGVALGGDSAGGNLAAAACQVLRDAGERLPAAQVLIYPALDRRLCTPSHAELATGFLLTRERIEWYLAHYAAPDAADPRVSPGLHPDVRGLPPVVITSCGFDPLRDEADAYVARLRDAGVPVVHRYEPGQVHGYANMDGLVPSADRAVARIVESLRALPAR